mmetsp:Transcript_7004/g.10697  ORF Transcript_7004/g.10697 Transcript_7004/m.10697 type:complete len:385 (+) Transcript_7004:66-1220(+)
MSFSGAVKLADINDFLGPSQACIKPQLDAQKRKAAQKARKSETRVLAPKETKKRTRGRKGVKLELEMDLDSETSSTGLFNMQLEGIGHFDQIKTSKDGKTAKITLNDCLACSGCVTSAETVLITAQSLGSFEAQLGVEGVYPVLSISPTALIGIAIAFDLDVLETARKLASFLKSIGVHSFVDQSVAQALCLMHAREEFVERFRAKKTPVLCSECPGWVCYAEKTQGRKVLSYLSNTRSPQQVTGVIVKHILSEECNVEKKQIFHCAVMPCYDKKLEASRDEFKDPKLDAKDVQCVLTTTELMDLIKKKTGKNGLKSVKGINLNPLFWNISKDQKTLYRPPAHGASGGYLENIFHFAAKELFSIELKGDLKFVEGRNPDIRHVT